MKRIYIFLFISLFISSCSYSNNGLNTDQITSSSGATIIDKIKLDYNNRENIPIDNLFDSYDLSSFYSKDDYYIIKMLTSGEETNEGIESLTNSKYYIFNNLFNGVRSDKLSNDENLTIKCIKKSLNNNLVDYNYYEENIENDFLKGICLGRDEVIEGDNLKTLKDILIIQLKSNYKKNSNICDTIPKIDNQNLSYFLCYGLAYRDIESVNNLMKLYISSDLSDNCDILKNENSYLYDTCVFKDNKIWE